MNINKTLQQFTNKNIGHLVGSQWGGKWRPMGREKKKIKGGKKEKVYSYRIQWSSAYIIAFLKTI